PAVRLAGLLPQSRHRVVEEPLHDRRSHSVNELAVVRAEGTEPVQGALDFGMSNRVRLLVQLTDGSVQRARPAPDSILLDRLVDYGLGRRCLALSLVAVVGTGLLEIVD